MCIKSVLYAEDDENDAFLMQRAFAKIGEHEALRIVRNGQLATEYLSGMGAFGSRKEFPLPDMLLLDVKMPKMSGLEVLQWIRERPAFNALTVVMLTSSTQPADVQFCADHGANAYLVKPCRSDLLYDLMPKVLTAGVTESAGVRRLEIPGNQLPELGPGDDGAASR